MQTYTVGCSSLTATYNAGRYTAESKQDACDMARRDWQHRFRDAGAFRFYVTGTSDAECEDEE